MSVQGSFQLSWAGSGIPSTYNANSVGFPIGQVTVYNNTPARIALYPSLPSVRPSGLFPWGGIIVPAFYPITVPIPLWTGFAFASDGTAPFTLSSLTIFIQGAPSTSPPPLSPFGPSGWGAGILPASLTPINPGDPILAWQIDQVIQFLTGGSVSGPLTISGRITSTGGSSGFVLDDSDGDGPPDNFTLLLNNGLFSLFSSVLGAAALTALENGRVSIPLTGSSLKPLLSFVPVAGIVSTNITPTPTPTEYTLNGLPLSAVMALVSIGGSTNNDTVFVGPPASGAGFGYNPSLIGSGGSGNATLNGMVNIDTPGKISMNSTASSLLSYTLYLLGYFEPT